VHFVEVYCEHQTVTFKNIKQLSDWCDKQKNRGRPSTTVNRHPLYSAQQLLW